LLLIITALVTAWRWHCSYSDSVAVHCSYSDGVAVHCSYSDSVVVHCSYSDSVVFWSSSLYHAENLSP
jgi:hypothetical protein